MDEWMEAPHWLALMHAFLGFPTQVLEGAVAELAQQLPALHRLIDAIALLDMLCSFAVVVHASRTCCI